MGVMGFAALGGLAGVVVSMPPVDAAWEAGGLGVIAGLVVGVITLSGCLAVWQKVGPMALCGDLRYFDDWLCLYAYAD